MNNKRITRFSMLILVIMLSLSKLTGSSNNDEYITTANEASITE